MSHSVRRTAVLCPIVLALSNCSAPPRTAAGPVPRSACAVVASGAAPESVVVAASASVDPTHAPVPANAAERFVFAQAYETLIDVDCAGSVHPALAGSWMLDATRTRVTLAIRDGARFSDGKPLTASDVLAAWRAAGGRSADAPTLPRRIADATTVVDDRTLTVSLPDTAWLVLADPALAVYEPSPGPAFPPGTGPYRIEPNTASNGSLVLVRVAPQSAPRIVLRISTNGDARDAIDAGVDALVTRDPAAVSYAAAHSNLATIPLPWSRVYALFVPEAGADSGGGSPLSFVSDSGLRASLARDAVQAEARVAGPPYWWSDTSGCAADALGATAAFANSRGSSRIVYRRDDRVARGLAERLVALSRGLTAAGLAPGEFDRALRVGGERVYVLALPRSSLSPCVDLAALASTAPWLARDGGRLQQMLVPLIETRARAIMNRDRVTASIDWDGTLRFGIRSPR